MEITANIGPGPGGCARKDDFKEIRQAFFANSTYLSLLKVMRGKAKQGDIEHLKKAHNFFRRAGEGYLIFTEGNHKTKLEAFCRTDNFMEDIKIVLDVLIICRRGECMVRDKRFEAGRKALFDFASQKNGTAAFIKKSLNTLKAITKGEAVKPTDIALPAFFFKVLVYDALAKLSVPRNGCF